MRNAKKTIVVVALIALMAIPSMFAYFTAMDEKTNTFTIGNVDIVLTSVDTGRTDAVAPKTPIDTDGATVDVTAPAGAYVFVEVDAADTLTIAGLDEAVWTPVDGHAGVYVYNNLEEVTNTASLDLYDTVTVGDLAEDKMGETAQFNITAYAIQADNLEVSTAKEIFELF